MQLDKPIIIEAKSRKEADAILINLNQKTGHHLHINDLEDIRVETLVIGISKKIVDKNNYVWVGTKYTNDGWLLESEYLKIVLNKQKQ